MLITFKIIIALWVVYIIGFIIALGYDALTALFYLLVGGQICFYGTGLLGIVAFIENAYCKEPDVSSKEAELPK